MRETGVGALLEGAVEAGVFPGGVLVVADQGQPVVRHAFGRVARVPEPGPNVTLGTAYDVASLTKVVATTCVVMRLLEAGRLALDTPAAAFVPELARQADGRERILVRHLLEHSGGLTWWRPFYERVLAGDGLGAGSRRDAMLRMAAAEPLEAAPGSRCLYSDLSFMILGFVCERAGGDRLDVLAARTVFEPLGMAGAGFVDLEAHPIMRPDPVAPTEMCPRRGLVKGEVHDDNCHAAGGIMGHAGLFATAEDLSRLCAALVAAWQGRRTTGGFTPALVRTFFAPCGIAGSTGRLGWDGPSPEPGASQAGDLWPREDAVGHMGFTGTSLWIDLRRGRWVVLLTNRVHPSRRDERIKQVRPRVHDAVVRMLG